MRKNKPPSKLEIQDSNSCELITIFIRTYFLRNKFNMEWLEIEFQKPDKHPELLEYFKKKILRVRDSNDLTAGKKAIAISRKPHLPEKYNYGII